MERVKMNWRGVEEVATGALMKALIKSNAEEVADNARAAGIRVEGKPGDIELPVTVYGPFETDGIRYANRAVCRVVLTHESGQAVQAKHGLLTKAAAAAGLTVGKRKRT